MNGFIISLPLLVLTICFIIRVPIGLGMVLSGAIFLMARGLDLGLASDVITSQIYCNGTIVAIPLFIFTANIMNSAKVTEYMFTFVKSLIGKKRGAMAYINIVVSLIFSGMTGSATADAAGIGTMEIAAMNKDGYDSKFSAAITAATATVGPIFPPSIPLVIYAIIAQVSVGKLFLGGMIPAVLICLILGIYVGFVSKKRDYPAGVSFTFKEFSRYTLKALPALMTPVILLGGIYTGFVTATEAGALAALYTIIISLLAYRVMTFKGFVKVIEMTVKQTGVVMAIIAGAYVMSFVVNSSGIAKIIAQWFLGLTSNKYIFLLIVNIVFLFLGMLFDTMVLLFIFLPLVLPVVQALQIDLVHFGVVLVVNIMIGLCTPPYGMLCYITSGIAKVKLNDVFKEIIPMTALMVIVLLLITYIPVLITGLPNLLMK